MPELRTFIPKVFFSLFFLFFTPMELGSIIQFLEHKSILVTGITGFLAKLFVEKVLRVQPNIKNIYCLVRAPDSESASKRFHNEVIEKHLFNVLKEKMGDNFNPFVMEKVTLVPGDISLENFGVTDINSLEEMWRDVHIVVNVAATTNFYERYDAALRINTLGAKHVINFAKKCANMEILLHVSTAYVAGEAEGLILESPCDMGNETLNRNIVDMETEVIEKRLTELQNEGATEEEIKLAMNELGAQRARRYGWPNTYVFTKAMGEILLGRLKENIPLVIVRPSIITSTYKEPFPGWMEGLRTLDSVAVGYAKGKFTNFLGDPKTPTDLIPADIAVNSMLVVMEAHTNKPLCEYVYHIGSSIANPTTIKAIRDGGITYFMNNPLVGKNGNPIKVGKAKMLTSMAQFKIYMAIRYLYPLKVLEFVNCMMFQYFRVTCIDLKRKLNTVMQLAELYRPYMFFKGIFDDRNTEKLRRAGRLNGTEADIFYFDPRIINWDDYFVNTHFPGIVKYVLKFN